MFFLQPRLHNSGAYYQLNGVPDWLFLSKHHEEQENYPYLHMFQVVWNIRLLHIFNTFRSIKFRSALKEGLFKTIRIHSKSSKHLQKMAE